MQKIKIHRFDQEASQRRLHVNWELTGRNRLHKGRGSASLVEGELEPGQGWAHEGEAAAQWEDRDARDEVRQAGQDLWGPLDPAKGKSFGFYSRWAGKTLKGFKQEVMWSDIHWKQITLAIAWRLAYNRAKGEGGRPVRGCCVCQGERWWWLWPGRAQCWGWTKLARCRVYFGSRVDKTWLMDYMWRCGGWL